MLCVYSKRLTLVCIKLEIHEMKEDLELQKLILRRFERLQRLRGVAHSEVKGCWCRRQYRTLRRCSWLSFVVQRLNWVESIREYSK